MIVFSKLTGKPIGKRPLGGSRLDGITILEWILKYIRVYVNMRNWIDLA